jgi:hypothetical protein
MNVAFLPLSRLELMDAVAHYESELEGLGRRFWDAIDRHVAWIADNAEVPVCAMAYTGV